MCQNKIEAIQDLYILKQLCYKIIMALIVKIRVKKRQKRR